MKIRVLIAIILTLFTIWQSGIVQIIPGTDADGSNNYAVSIGNDDCYATFQTGDSFGAYYFCEPFPTQPKVQDPILPSFRRGDGIF